MYKFDKANYCSHADSVLRLENKRKILQGLLVTLLFEYANKISGTYSNNEFIELRNSITLRLESIFYHYDLLASINVSGEEIISSQSLSPLITDQIALKQDFLFDSIMFNTLSFFDYTSCLIEYTTGSNKKKLWGKLAKTARGKAELKETSLGKLIDELDRKWVSKLGDYRAELIHYSDDFVSNSFIYHAKECKYVITISAPTALKKYFKEFKLEENLNANLNEVTLWIVENSIECVIKLVKELITYFDLVRKIPAGKEIYTFGEQKYPF